MSQHTLVKSPLKQTDEFREIHHLPVQMNIGLNLTKMSKTKLSSWNARKADWVNYKTYVEENKNCIEPIPSNYKRFTKLIKTAAGKTKPGDIHKIT